MLDSDTGALAFGEGRVRRACRRAHRSEVRRRHWGAGIGLETRWGVQCDAGRPEAALRQSPPMTAKSGSTFHAPFLSPASQSIYRPFPVTVVLATGRKSMIERDMTGLTSSVAAPMPLRRPGSIRRRPPLAAIASATSPPGRPGHTSADRTHNKPPGARREPPRLAEAAATAPAMPRVAPPRPRRAPPDRDHRHAARGPSAHPPRRPQSSPRRPPARTRRKPRQGPHASPTPKRRRR